MSRSDYGPCMCGGCDSCQRAQGVDLTPCESCEQVNHDLDSDGYCSDCAAEIELVERAFDELPPVLQPHAATCRSCSSPAVDEGLCGDCYYAVFR